MNEIANMVRKLEVVTKRNVNEVFAGNYRSSFRGQGLELHDIRRYEDGDDIRHIDWINSAKQGSLYTRQYKETREITTIVLLDTSASMNFGSLGKTKREQAMEVFASILFSSFRNNDRFGAIIFSGKSMSYVPAGKGRGHFLGILGRGIEAFDQNEGADSDMCSALRFFLAVVKRHSIAFLVSDKVEHSAERFFKIASKKHDFVFVNVFDPFEIGEVPEGIFHVSDPETGDEGVVDFSDMVFRENFLKICQKRQSEVRSLLIRSAIDEVRISTQMSVYKELFQFFKFRQKKI